MSRFKNPLSSSKVNADSCQPFLPPKKMILRHLRKKVVKIISISAFVFCFTWTLYYFYFSRKVKKSTSELLKSFEKLIIGHTTEISTIGLDQDDPRLIEYIRQSYLVHPKVEEVCKYC